MKAKENKQSLDRRASLQSIEQQTEWDMVIIGGGATGLGTALDAAHRGYSTLLLEQADFAKGTSSRSTKLVHGGVRYLAQGQIKLVYEALHERGVLLQNAPHLIQRQAFVIPCYQWWAKWKYLIGLKLYDWLSGRFSFGKSKHLSPKKVQEALPGINLQSLQGGVEYFDGQFDDARLAINLAQTSAEQGGKLINYMKVVGLLKNNQGKIAGVKALDLESGTVHQIKAKVVINATGVFVDDILQMNHPSQKPTVRPSQGVHLVLDSSFMPKSKAMMIPETSDGRVLFAVPWHKHILLGTTDTPLDKHSLEPKALDQEIEFILHTAGQYLAKKPSRKDILSIFAGLRPLAAPDKNTQNTKEISRGHKLMISDTQLITITGGKWTTYRKMAEDTVNKAIEVGKLQPKECNTTQVKIHGYTHQPIEDNPLKLYGSDIPAIRDLVRQAPELGERLHPQFAYIKAQVVWAVQFEMARTVEDVLSRRLRILFLDAQAAIEMAPVVAKLMAISLQQDKHWVQKQIEEFETIANPYLPEQPEYTQSKAV
ncbi:glycerol-3-phosphate dehydrogenase/oxidase [Rapidithrix thailandica]|uniref:Glycerol-3-phosphate dehydrogenase/oxidase n=1 Tax=Rapidithrix thailandica TaxID=413964 RepID=A0AAW9S4K6_9BACT